MEKIDKKKKLPTFILFSLCICLPILLFTSMIIALFPAFDAITEVEEAEKIMRKPEVYEEVARTLALYCESTDRSFYADLSKTPLPQIIRKKRALIEPDSARITMGAGHYPFGYRLIRDVDHGTSRTNQWQLYMFGNGEKLLHVIELPVKDENRTRK